MTVMFLCWRRWCRNHVDEHADEDNDEEESKQGRHSSGFCCGCWGCCCWWPLIDLLWMLRMLLLMTAHWFAVDDGDAADDDRSLISAGGWCSDDDERGIQTKDLLCLGSAVDDVDARILVPAEDDAMGWAPASDDAGFFLPQLSFHPPWHSSLIHYRSDPYMYLNCIWLFLSIFKREHVLISFSSEMDDGHMAMVLSEAFASRHQGKQTTGSPGQQNSIYTSICQQKCWWTPGTDVRFLALCSAKVVRGPSWLVIPSGRAISCIIGIGLAYTSRNLTIPTWKMATMTIHDLKNCLFDSLMI